MKRQGIALDLHRDTATPLEWGGYIIRPTDAKHTDLAEAPHEPGIYAWYFRNGDLVYVGRSTSIANRLRQHKRWTFFHGGDPTYFSYRVIPERYVAGIEMAHIKTLSPRENTAEQGCSVPFWREISEAIRAAWEDVLPAQHERLDAHYTRLAQQIADRL